MNKLVVGLTGGIGSGKTEVSKRFEKLGITVADADIAAREVVQPGSEALKAIETHFGSSVITESGELNRSALREKIFADNSQRLWLEALLHPLIRQALEKTINGSASPYAILAAPLLLEAKDKMGVDRVLVVDSPESEQLARSSLRDNCSNQHIKAIMAKQLSRDARLNQADDIIDNSGSLDALSEQIATLHEKYLNTDFENTVI